MNGDDIGQFIYLVLLLGVIGGYFLIANKQRLGETARQAALWVLIFVGAIAGVGLWEGLRDTVSPRQSVSIATGTVVAPRQADGHYYLTLNIGGEAVDFVVDTGATNIVLSKNDAIRVGINPDQLIYSGRAFTANGEVRTAPVTLQNVKIGDVLEGSLRAMVNDGDLNTSLLGMSYLERYDRIEIRGNELILER